ncbi:MAG: DUF1345 domain-containing protein [Candidatus Levybacteria bacterium]|nr:DUF1345 domain-containing protein [Candidatus Levybacteria bacterium]
MEVLQKRAYDIQVFIALLILGVIHTSLSTKISTAKTIASFFGPAFWVVIPMSHLLVIAVALVLISYNKKELVRKLLLTVNIFLTVLLVRDVLTLVITLPQQKLGVVILWDAFLIWVSNVLIFAMWYWLLDRGGPIKRAHEKDTRSLKADLLFPQEVNELVGWKAWKPAFLDYIFMSFYSSMAFTPTDTLVLSKKMKGFLMLQGSISLVVLAMIAARAINIIS